MIFVEGDTDKLFFDRLVQYYRQTSSVPIASCEVRNMHGVSRYSSKLSGKLKGQIIPSAARKGMEVQAVCCSYDTDVFEYAERPVVDWSRVAAEIRRLGIKEFCEVTVEQMMEEGLYQEVRSLLDSGVTADMQSMQGLGYKELIPVLTAGASLQDAMERIKTGTRNYARRQLIWFRRDKNIRWLPSEQLDSAAKTIIHSLEE